MKKNTVKKINQLVERYGAKDLKDLVENYVENQWEDDGAQAYELWYGEVVVFYEDGAVEVE